MPGSEEKPSRKIKVYKKCCVPGCLNRTSIAAGVRFFKFPCNRKNKNIFEIWCRNVRVDPTSLNTFSMVCSEHFLPQYLTYGKTKVNLRRGAVPTINLPNSTPYKKIANATKPSGACKIIRSPKILKKTVKKEIFNEYYYIIDDNLNDNETTESDVKHCKNLSNVTFEKSKKQLIENNKINFSQVNNYKTKIIIIAQEDLEKQLLNLNESNRFLNTSDYTKFDDEKEIVDFVADDMLYDARDYIHEEEIVVNTNSDSDSSDDDIECLDCIEICECRKNKKQSRNWIEENDLPAEYLDDAFYEIKNNETNVQQHLDDIADDDFNDDYADNDDYDYIETEVDFQNQNCTKNKHKDSDVDEELKKIEDTLILLQRKRSLLMQNKRRKIKQKI